MESSILKSNFVCIERCACKSQLQHKTFMLQVFVTTAEMTLFFRVRTDVVCPNVEVIMSCVLAARPAEPVRPLVLRILGAAVVRGWARPRGLTVQRNSRGVRADHDREDPRGRRGRLQEAAHHHLPGPRTRSPVQLQGKGPTADIQPAARDTGRITFHVFSMLVVSALSWDE